uniref:Uncharacterized protein n=1 Tax=Arundo donax TaxID=35708 RepID=A0A0A8ZTB8_ARUDO
MNNQVHDTQRFQGLKQHYITNDHKAYKHGIKVHSTIANR